MSIVLALFISISNSILSIVMNKIAEYLRQISRTLYMIDIAKLISVSMFINSTIIPITLIYI